MTPEKAYDAMGFKSPEFIENPYGIKIYIGTKGKEDWCIEVPKGLAKLKCPKYPFEYNYCVYCVSEEEAIRTAREFSVLAHSRLANMRKGNDDGN